MLNPGEASTYGEMFAYDDATGTVINVADQYHSIFGILSGDHLKNWTFSAGKEGAGNITTAAAGAAININDVAHGLVTGDIINVQSANHEGTVVVTRIGADDFTVPVAYVGDEACFWQQGDRLIAGAGAAGRYRFSFSTSLTAGGNLKTYKFELACNTTHVDESATERKIGTGADIGNMSSGGILEVSAGDEVSLTVKNTGDTTDLTLKHANVSVNRI